MIPAWPLCLIILHLTACILIAIQYGPFTAACWLMAFTVFVVGGSQPRTNDSVFYRTGGDG